MYVLAAILTQHNQNSTFECAVNCIFVPGTKRFTDIMNEQKKVMGMFSVSRFWFCFKTIIKSRQRCLRINSE